MIYRRRPSPLHAARAVVGLAWCAAVSGAALIVHHPAVLAVLVVAVVGASAGARSLRAVLVALAFAVPFGVTIILCNGVFSRNGITVVWRLGGAWDVTEEALVQGGVYALSAVVIVCVARLYSAAVDPDDLLRSCRRLSFTSALTAALATRLVPVLWRDGQRLADAQRARASGAASRLTLMRAVSTGAMDRALDVAATLEVRGYRAPRAPAAASASGAPAAARARRWWRPGASAPRGGKHRIRGLGRPTDAVSAPPRSPEDLASLARPPRGGEHRIRGLGRPTDAVSVRPWSRHDLAFLASGAAALVLAVLSRDLAAFASYPRIVADWHPGAWLVTVGLVAAVLAPFADRRGIA